MFAGGLTIWDVVVMMLSTILVRVVDSCMLLPVGMIEDYVSSLGCK